VLAAVIEAEGIEPSDDELLAAIEEAGPTDGTSPKKLLERLRSTGRVDALKEDLAQRSAVELITSSAKPVPLVETTGS
jgi:trigger factor